ncbi:MAG TPA: RHS repeat domain-containing protein [Flavisolibacter sp.]|jgi:YD repeat-containing protein
MKALFVAVAIFVSVQSGAQYYYKDIIGTKESAELITSYRNNNVRTVALNSYTVNNTPIDNFLIRQEYISGQQALRTITKTEYTQPSYLTSFIDANGRVVKTTDSADGMINTTTYQYNANGNLTAVLFTAGDTLTAVKTDDHLWFYDNQNKVQKMLRIKNKRDTAVVSFKLDDKGNVIEEQERRRALTEEPYYYYYDNTNRLTDIVRFSKKANRLLPEYMFEYSDKNQVIQRITVPQNSSDYLIWRYAFNDKGLKTKEVIFNKGKEQTGKVEYIYTFQ